MLNAYYVICNVNIYIFAIYRDLWENKFYSHFYVLTLLNYVKSLRYFSIHIIQR